MIITDHSSFDYPSIVRDSQLVFDSRNATRRHDLQSQGDARQVSQQKTHINVEIL